MQFKLLNEKFPSKSKFLFLTTAISFTSIFLLSYLFSIWEIEISDFNSFLLCISLWLFSGVGFRWVLPDWVKKKDVLGTIDLREDHIVVFREKEEVFHFSDWNIKQVNKNHYRGFTPKDIDSISNGITSIHMENKKGESRHLKFLIDDSESYYCFEMYLERNT